MLFPVKMRRYNLMQTDTVDSTPQAMMIPAIKVFLFGGFSKLGIMPGGAFIAGPW